MDSLTEFIARTLGATVPPKVAPWLGRHVDPEDALTQAEAVQLLWLVSQWKADDAGEAQAVERSRRAVREAYTTTQRYPQHPEAGGWLAVATGSLRGALWATQWWWRLVDGWEQWQSRGLGVKRYRVHGPDEASLVRGTPVGRFAVRTLWWTDGVRRFAPALRYREQTPSEWRQQQDPTLVHAVDLMATGQSLGTFASAAVAFAVADRFDRRSVRFHTPPSRALEKALTTYRGDTPSVRARSWPARPSRAFVEARGRSWRHARRGVAHGR